MSHLAAIELLTLVVLATPAAADGTEDVVTGAVGSAVFSAIVCGGLGQSELFDEVSKDPQARRGWLLGAAGIYGADTKEDTLEHDLQSEAGTPVDFSLKNSFGFKGQAGYRCHPRFSAEAEVEWLDGFDGTAFLGSLGETVSIDLEPLVITTNLKGYVLTGRYQPFVLIGGGGMIIETKFEDQAGLSAKDTLRGIVIRFGGGVDFYATDQVVLTLGLDYLMPFGEVEDFDYVSIGWGLRYRF